MTKPISSSGSSVVTALAFDFTDGFHDTANVVATSVSTRAMSPRIAVGYAAILDFVGAFISLEVAATVATTSSSSSAIELQAPCSSPGWSVRSPRSLIHVVLRVAVGLLARPDRRDRRLDPGRRGPDAVLGDGIVAKVADCPALVAPVLAFVVGAIAIVCCYRIVGRQRAGPVTRGFRFGQGAGLGGLLALAHGTNDAQKTMGVITLALVINGNLSSEGFEVPDLGGASRRRARSRSAPTREAGGSSRRWAPGSSRWTRRRDSRPKGPARP